MINTNLSPVNQKYIENQKTRQNSHKNQNASNIQYADEFVLSNKNGKKDSKKKIMAIASAVAISAIAAIYVLFSKDKSLNNAKFKEYIKFKPASTMDEAKKYASENFNIKNFELDDDLEIANWINEGLTNINNIFKGKAHMPKSVGFGKLDAEKSKEITPIAFVDSLDNLSIVKEAFDKEKAINEITNIMESIQTKGIPRGADYSKVKKLLEKYKAMQRNPNDYSKINWTNMLLEIEDMLSNLIEPARGLSMLWKNKKTQKMLIESGINLDLEKIFLMPKKEQSKILQNCLEIFEKNGIIINLKGASRYSSEFDTIYHEIGHLLNQKNSSLYTQIFGKLSDRKSQVAKFRQDFQKQTTAQKVSNYAQTNPKEFVAEVFAQLCNNKKPDDDVMELYKYYNGVTF